MVEADLENNVEFAVLDELEDFSENFLDPDYGAQGGFRSEVIIQQEQADDDGLNYSYEVCEQRPPLPVWLEHHIRLNIISTPLPHYHHSAPV